VITAAGSRRAKSPAIGPATKLGVNPAIAYDPATPAIPAKTARRIGTASGRRLDRRFGTGAIMVGRE